MTTKSRARAGPVRRVLLWTGAVGLAALGTLVTGAVGRELLAGIASPSVCAWVSGGLAVLIAILVPTSLDLVVAARYRRLDGSARNTLAETLPLWNAALVAVLVLAFPVFTRGALERHGGWLWLGAPDNALARLVSRLGRVIPRSEAATASPSPPALPESPRPSATPRAVGAVPSATVPASATAAPSASAPAAPGVLAAFEQDQSTEEIFRTRAPSVVLIEVRSRIERDSLLSDYLDRLGLDVQEGSGSGFFVGDGLIVTNDHVMRGAESARVTTYDGRRFDKVAVLAESRDHDLSLLSVEGAKAPALPLLPRDTDIPVGSGALAIGSPLGLEFSLTEGIVSGKRKLHGTDFLQMQTPIAPGSSGGPLLNRRGQLIGVNTAVMSANLNLAVHVRHVHALLEAPRTPRELTPFAARAQVVEVATIGAESSSIERISYAQVAQMLAAVVERCVKNAPENASVTFTTTSLTGQATIESNLDEESVSCLSERGRILTLLVGMLLSEIFQREIAGGKNVGLRFVIEGVGGSDGAGGAASSRRLTLSFMLTKARSPSARAP